MNECFNCLEAIEYAENMEDTCESCGDKTYDLCEFVNSKGETKIYCEPCVDYHTIMKSSLDDMMKIEKGGKCEKSYKELMDEVSDLTRKHLKMEDKCEKCCVRDGDNKMYYECCCAEDAITVMKDNERARREGYVEVNGRWIKYRLVMECKCCETLKAINDFEYIKIRECRSNKCEECFYRELRQHHRYREFQQHHKITQEEKEKRQAIRARTKRVRNNSISKLIQK